MKEELTTKMHSEFQVTPETEIKHKSFAVLGLIGSGLTVKQALRFSGVTYADIKKHLKEYNELFPEKVVLE